MLGPGTPTGVLRRKLRYKNKLCVLNIYRKISYWSDERYYLSSVEEESRRIVPVRFKNDPVRHSTMISDCVVEKLNKIEKDTVGRENYGMNILF